MTDEFFEFLIFRITVLLLYLHSDCCLQFFASIVQISRLWQTNGIVVELKEVS